MLGDQGGVRQRGPAPVRVGEELLVDEVEHLALSHRVPDFGINPGCGEKRVCTRGVERLHFAKALADRRAIVVVTARRNANIALGWAQLRGALPPLDAAFARLAAAPRASSESPPSPTGAE